MNMGRFCNILRGKFKLPQLLPTRGVSCADEPEFSVKPSNHRVLLGGNVHTDNFADATRLALLDQRIEHCEFHLAFQDAATHQPNVDLQSFARHASDQNRDQPVVSELVGQPPVERQTLRVLSHGFDFRASISARRQIELIGLVNQLGDPLEIHWSQRSDLRDHFERSQELSVILEFALVYIALYVFSVVGATAYIFPYDLVYFEVPF